MVLLAPLGSSVASDELVVPMNLVTEAGVGAPLGTVTLSDGPSGLVLKLALSNELAPGPHGFHLHENGACEAGERDGRMVPALAAGGHYDPDGTGRHRGPGGDGHRGDLPVIHVGVDEDGATETTHALVAPHLRLADAVGRALVIRQFGDTFSDEPEPLGGGGPAVACGVVPAL